MAHAKSYQELDVYKLSKQLAKDIFQLSKRFPKEEMYSLTDQIRRSSRSIGAQVAEAWAKRRYEKHFISKLTDADGEQQETKHWIDTASDCGYLSDAEVKDLSSRYASVGKMLNNMIGKSHLFCFKDSKSSNGITIDHRSPITDHNESNNEN